MSAIWFDRYQAWTQTNQDRFTRIVNRLLAAPFLTRHKDDNRRDYYFLQRNEEVFSGYLALGGWELVKHDALGSYTLRSAEGQNRLHLNLEESILLLLLRLIYEEEQRKVRLTDEVIITVRQLQQRYRVLELRDRPITQQTLGRLVSLLRRFNLADTRVGSAHDPDTRLILYPTLALAVEVGSIRQVYDRLIAYAGDDEALVQERDELFADNGVTGADGDEDAPAAGGTESQEPQGVPREGEGQP